MAFVSPSFWCCGSHKTVAVKCRTPTFTVCTHLAIACPLCVLSCVCPVHAVRIEDITTQNHYKNSAEQEQQILDRQTLSTALLETYEGCDAPPRLREFTQYREDRRDGLTFFTNPAYFFALWKHQQDQQIENRKRRKVGHL